MVYHGKSQSIKRWWLGVYPCFRKPPYQFVAPRWVSWRNPKVPVLVDDNGTQYDTQMIAGARGNLGNLGRRAKSVGCRWFKGNVGRNHYRLSGWWFGTFYISPILGIIIPIDFHIFQRGGPTTNQFLFRVSPLDMGGSFWSAWKSLLCLVMFPKRGS